MPPLSITFVRHGSLPPEYSRCFSGTTDVGLSPVGVRESEAIGRYLADRTYTKVYTGTLLRVRETWTAATRFAHKLPEPVCDSRLNEMDFGDWSLVPFSELRERYPEEFARWSFGAADFRFPNGGLVGDFIRRTREAMADIQSGGGDHPVVFSHGGVIMSLIADLLGMPRSEAFSVWIGRGGVAELRRGASGKFQLVKLFRPFDCGE